MVTSTNSPLPYNTNNTNTSNTNNTNNTSNNAAMHQLEIGVTAWSHGMVPNFVTSNCAIAQVSISSLFPSHFYLFVVHEIYESAASGFIVS